MRILFLFLACLIISMNGLSAQDKLNGIVTDAHTGETLVGASIILTESFKGITSDAKGRFVIKGVKPEPIPVRVSFIGYQTYQDTIFPPFQHEYHITLIPFSVLVAEVEVAGIRVSENMPVAQTNLNESDIRKENTGRDLPYILDHTPNVVVNSDAGAGIGYTGLRIRGTDATRINVTMNGIPINDAESQGVFWIDMPDLASSVANIQVQRGVGTSTHGAGSFGGTISIQTNQLKPEPFAEISSTAGMFLSFKNSAEFGTGLLGKHFAFTGRFSKINSDGYIDRAWSDLTSFFFSGGYYGKSTTVRFNVITGKERTYQAWYGVPGYLLDSLRTFNPAGTDNGNLSKPYENETDNYQQDHYQLFIDQQAGKYTILNLALYYTRGKGYYEQYKTSQFLPKYNMDTVFTNNDTIMYSDLIRQLWLDNHLIGANFTARYAKKKWDVVAGAGFNTYFGSHYGKVVWAQFAGNNSFNHEFYRHTSLKMDGNLYAKATFEAYPGLHIFADLQYRLVRYTVDGFRNNPLITVDQFYHFLNPKAGINYRINSNHILYLYFGMATKEPNRDDFEAGITHQPKPETLRDLELGYTNRGKIHEWMANIYWMDYSNQLVQTGKINDVGAYTRINIPRSYRLGIELSGQLRPHRTFLMKAHAAFSLNKIMNFTEYIDNYDTGIQDSVFYASTDIAFSPNINAGFVFTYSPVRNLDIEITGKYISHQYLDNTSNQQRMLNPYFINDFRVRYELAFKKYFCIRFNLMVNNFTNRFYEPNGYTFSYVWGGELTTENYFYPQAGIHVLGGISIGFTKFSP